jgi:hypothetical protein
MDTSMILLPLAACRFRKLGGDVLPEILFPVIRRQVLLEELAHVGQRDQLHDVGDLQRPRQGLQLVRPLRKGQARPSWFGSRQPIGTGTLPFVRYCRPDPAKFAGRRCRDRSIPCRC